MQLKSGRSIIVIISEKQIMNLIEIARRYSSVCHQMDWDDHETEVCALLKDIRIQQSEELKVIG